MSGVTTFTQPDFTSQSGAAYKANIDGAIAALARLAALFAPHQQATADMTVRLNGGTIFNPVTLARSTVAAQSTGTITAPSGDPRYDIVYVDRESGAVGVATGSESASPADPAVPSGKVPVARVRLTVGQTEIVNADIDDVRDLFALGLPFGTGANDIVTLDGSGALPALDGSALTGITDEGLASDMRLAFLKLAELDGDRLNMAAGIADAYADESDVDTAASSGQTYDAGGDYYTNPGGETRIAGATPTAPQGGTAANINDDNPATTAVTGALPDLSAASLKDRIYWKLDLGSAKTVTKIEAKQLKQTSSSRSMILCYSTDDTTYTQLGSTISVTSSPADFANTGSVSARYVAVAQGAYNASTETNTIGDLNAYEIADPADMTLVSEAFTAAAAPDTARVHVQVTEVDAVTVNTDLMVDVSRDDGSTWETAVLALAASLADGTKAYEDTAVDLSGQPSGTDLRYRVRTDNAKEVRIHGAVLQWA